MTTPELILQAQVAQVKIAQLLDVLVLGPKDVRATTTALVDESKRLHCAATELANRAAGNKPPKRGD